jgi:hypothetical protein
MATEARSQIWFLYGESKRRRQNEAVWLSYEGGRIKIDPEDLSN